MTLSGRVLVAEDNPSNQMLIRLLLEKMGLTPTIAADGQIAVDIFDSEPFDIVLMDMMMPNMNGYEATRALRKRGVTTPIIALTANAMKGDREKCLGAGCDEYVTKPITRDRLEEVLSMYLGKDDENLQKGNEKMSDKFKDNAPIVSDLANDPDLYVVAEMFVERLNEIIENIKAALNANDMQQLKDLFHEIKGAGGSAGYQILTEKSAHIETLILACDDNMKSAIEEFINLCGRVQAPQKV